MSYAVIFLLVVLALRLIFRGKRIPKAKPQAASSSLTRWLESESRDVTRPRDPRTKFCVASIGTAVTIKYNSARRTITPLRVFTKPDFHKTYVLADEAGEQRTFDIDDISLSAKQMRDLVRTEYKKQKQKQAAKPKGKNEMKPAEATPQTPPEIDWNEFF